MENITNVKLTKCEESLYIKPCRMLYRQNGKHRAWDLMKVHDSVAVIIFNVSRQVLIFVKQFRPAVYYAEISNEKMETEIDINKYPPSLGVTIELCAGIVDKSISLEETTREEILEECGYDVPISSIQKVLSSRFGVGIAGSRQHMYYVEVTDSMKVSAGGGNISEGEYIEVVEMDLKQARSLIYDDSIPRPTAFILGLMWFFYEKQKI